PPSRLTSDGKSSSSSHRSRRRPIRRQHEMKRERFALCLATPKRSKYWFSRSGTRSLRK
ncbi:unnamed protein product, partial [Phaeothamnion confervicola]